MYHIILLQYNNYYIERGINAAILDLRDGQVGYHRGVVRYSIYIVMWYYRCGFEHYARVIYSE